MESVVRGLVVYVFVWLVFRISGKRSLAEITTFDFVLLLIISEAAQAALLGGNNSMTNSFLLIITIVLIDIAVSLWKQRSEWFERFVDSAPLVVVAHGAPLKERMNKERIDVADILVAARRQRGLERLEQIKFAVLECNGGITIIAREQDAKPRNSPPSETVA
jgi:uncharacterized membrane protein YcaP (DUF421 family)